MLCWLNGSLLDSVLLADWSAHAHADDVCKKACRPPEMYADAGARSALWACARSINQSFIRLATAGDTRRARIPKAIESWFYSPVNFVLTLLVFWWTGKLFWWTNKLFWWTNKLVYQSTRKLKWSAQNLLVSKNQNSMAFGGFLLALFGFLSPVLSVTVPGKGRI